MEAPAPTRARLESIDLLRGLVMILMALDHVRDFLGAPGANPTDMATTTAPLFFTRWVTHICAPTFFLLTGTGAYLMLRRKTKKQLSGFLVTRGLWLIFLEVVVLRCFALQFNFEYRLTMLVVIWALGWAMIILAALVYLPDAAVIVFGVILITTHNLLDPVQASSFGAFAPLWHILHVPGVLLATPRFMIFLAYPLIPWIGVTAVGYGLGNIYHWTPDRRRTFLLSVGIALTAAFLIVRRINLYGDPIRWSHQRSGAFTFLSFLNTTKYPPSLLFLLMTLGPAMLLLWAFDRGTPKWLRPVVVFGRVPLFYYALHLVLTHLVAIVICYARYGEVHWMFESPSPAQYPVTPPPGWGVGLPMTYLVWVFVVIALYPVCAWFARLKQRRTDPWLSYL